MYYGKEFSAAVISHAWEWKFVAVRWTHYSLSVWRVKASHYFTQEFDATKFRKRNRNHTE